LRNSFIGISKMDILGSATSADCEIIGEGNESADCGDALADATLYTAGGERSDVTPFTKLYVLLLDVVPRIREYSLLSTTKTIDIANTHPTIIASKEKTVSNKFCRLFARFVKVFTEYGQCFEPGYLSGDPTEVTHAYWEFVNCLKTEVRKTGDSN
ncbi:hypothetical protein C7212DRAFT_202879, partial [Tuber magnatum]